MEASPPGEINSLGWPAEELFYAIVPWRSGRCANATRLARVNRIRPNDHYRFAQILLLLLLRVLENYSSIVADLQLGESVFNSQSIELIIETRL